MSAITPTKKVTAFLVGGALALIAFYLAVDVFAVVEEWPEPQITGAFALFFGFVLAWLVPEGAWDKIGRHTDGDVELPDEDESGH